MAEMVLALAAQGLTDKAIARKLGIATSTLALWKGKHESFSDALGDAKEISNELVIAALFQRAIGYRHQAIKFFCHEGVIVSQRYTEVYAPDVGACTMWLKNRDPDHWRDSNAKEVDPNALTDAQLAAIAAKGKE